MSRALRWHAVRAAQWSAALEACISTALVLAAHGLRGTAEAAESRGNAELAADLGALACAVEHLDRDVATAFSAAADRQFATREANPGLPLEGGR